MDERILHIQHCMYQYSRAIYRSIKDLIDPFVDPQTQLEYRREVLSACEGTMERLAQDPHYFAKPDKALFQDIRRYFPITVQAQVAWAVTAGVDLGVTSTQVVTPVGREYALPGAGSTWVRSSGTCALSCAPVASPRSSSARCVASSTRRNQAGTSVMSLPRSIMAPYRRRCLAASADAVDACRAGTRSTGATNIVRRIASIRRSVRSS